MQITEVCLSFLAFSHSKNIFLIILEVCYYLNFLGYRILRCCWWRYRLSDLRTHEERNRKERIQVFFERCYRQTRCFIYTRTKKVIQYSKPSLNSSILNLQVNIVNLSISLKLFKKHAFFKKVFINLYKTNEENIIMSFTKRSKNILQK